jgi:hypothetical protein
VQASGPRHLHVTGWDDDNVRICLFYGDPPAAGKPWPRTIRSPKALLLHAGEGEHKDLVEWLEDNCAGAAGSKRQRQA